MSRLGLVVLMKKCNPCPDTNRHLCLDIIQLSKKGPPLIMTASRHERGPTKSVSAGGVFVHEAARGLRSQRQSPDGRQD